MIVRTLKDEKLSSRMGQSIPGRREWCLVMAEGEYLEGVGRRSGEVEWSGEGRPERKPPTSEKERSPSSPSRA